MGRWSGRALLVTGTNLNRLGYQKKEMGCGGISFICFYAQFFGLSQAMLDFVQQSLSEGFSFFRELTCIIRC